MAVSDKHKASVKAYNEKTYALFQFALRRDEDADMIDSIKRAKEHGISRREWLRIMYDAVNRGR